MRERPRFLADPPVWQGSLGLSPLCKVCLLVQKIRLKKDDKSQCGTSSHMEKWIYKLKVQWKVIFFPYLHILRLHAVAYQQFWNFTPNNKFLDTSFAWAALDYDLRDLGLSHHKFNGFVGFLCGSFMSLPACRTLLHLYRSQLAVEPGSVCSLGGVLDALWRDLRLLSVCFVIST